MAEKKQATKNVERNTQIGNLKGDQQNRMLGGEKTPKHLEYKGTPKRLAEAEKSMVKKGQNRVVDLRAGKDKALFDATKNKGTKVTPKKLGDAKAKVEARQKKADAAAAAKKKK